MIHGGPCYTMNMQVSLIKELTSPLDDSPHKSALLTPILVL